MKCSACNYVVNESENGKNIVDGQEQFIQLINSFHYKSKDGSLEEAYLFACPKCGTVKLLSWE